MQTQDPNTHLLPPYWGITLIGPRLNEQLVECKSIHLIYVTILDSKCVTQLVSIPDIAYQCIQFIEKYGISELRND